MSNRIHRIRQGNGAKRLVFIHGNMGSARWWLPAMDALKADCDMIAVDLRGFGGSPDGPDQVAMIDHAHDIRDILQDQDFEGFVLVGHSLGGAVAMQFAALYPEDLSGLVLVDSAPLTGLSPVDYALLEMVLGNPEMLVASLKMTMALPVDEEYFRGLAEDCLRGIPAVIPNTRALEKIDFSRDAGRFEKPVLVVHGEHDALIPVRESQQTAAAYPQGRLTVISGCGHNPQVEATAVFAETLMNFLNGKEG